KNADVFKSTDNGSTFNKVATQLSSGSGGLLAIGVDPSGIVWTGGEMHNGVYSTPDNGSAWPLDNRLDDAHGFKGNLNAIGFTKAGEPIATRTTGSQSVEVLRSGAWTAAGNGMDG